jgi:hypothetical protein
MLTPSVQGPTGPTGTFHPGILIDPVPPAGPTGATGPTAGPSTHAPGMSGVAGPTGPSRPSAGVTGISGPPGPKFAHDMTLAEKSFAARYPNVKEFTFKLISDLGDDFTKTIFGTVAELRPWVLQLNTPEFGLGVFVIDEHGKPHRLPGTLDLRDPNNPRLARPDDDPDAGLPTEAISRAIDEFSPISDEAPKKDPPPEIEARSKNDDKTVAAGDEPIQPHDGCLGDSGSRGGSEGEHKAAHAENGISGDDVVPEVHICVHCHLNPPDGSERPIADSEEWIHPRCEKAFINARLAEEGLLKDAPTSDPVDPLMEMLERIERELPGEDPTPKTAATVDVSAVREHLSIIATRAKAALNGAKAPGLLQLSRLDPTNNKLVPRRFRVDDVEGMIEFAISNSKAGYNIYIEGRLVRPDLNGNERGKLADTVAVFAHVIDNDADTGKSWTPTKPIGLTVGTSPGNSQDWLFYREAIFDAEQGQKLGKHIREATGTDHDTGNVTQPYRVAGTINYPSKAKIARGRVTAPTKLIKFNPEVLWTPEEIEQAFPLPEQSTNGGGAQADPRADESSIPADTMKVIRDGVPKDHRSHAFWNVMLVLKRMGWSIDGIAALLERYPNGIAAKYTGRLHDEVKRAYDKIKHKPTPAAPTDDPDEAAEADPLMRPLPPPEPYPLDALFELTSAAQAICDIVQSPIEMCAGAVLASTSFAVSAHINIKLPTGQVKPVSCWFWCVAVSGERKSTTDDHAFEPQKQHEKKLHAQRIIAMADYAARKRIWEAQAKAIDKQFKDPGAAGSEAHQKELKDIGPEPEEPLTALLMSANFTYEGLARCLHLGQPLYGIIGTEGGQFTGGHGMTISAKTNTVANMNYLWDGEPAKRVRADETIMLFGRRAGMHLMIQPKAAASVLGDELLIELGFLSRILMCAPESLIGKRPSKPTPPEAEQALQQYKDRLRKILDSPYSLASGTRNELEPRDVPFSADAAALFREFVDEIEKQMAPDGEYESIRAFAGKLPEHAARLGATIAAYRDLNFTELSHEDYLRGMRLAVYYASEAKRISGTGTVTSELLPEQLLPPAQELLNWLLRVWAKPTVSARDIYTFGPNSIRNRKSAIALAEILVEHGWLAEIETRRHDMKKWRVQKPNQ